MPMGSVLQENVTEWPRRPVRTTSSGPRAASSRNSTKWVGRSGQTAAWRRRRRPSRASAPGRPEADHEARNEKAV